jgi:hypothetical protein
MRTTRFDSLFKTLMLVALGLTLFPSNLYGQGRGRQTETEVATQAFNKEEALKKRDEVHRWLMSERVEEGISLPVRAPASNEEKSSIDRPERVERPVRVGLTKSVQKRVAFDDLKPGNLNKKVRMRPQGALRATDDGGYVYTTALTSPEATALRVHFTDFWLPEAAELYLFTEDGQVFGPYTGKGPHDDGDFWSHTVMGETVQLQLRHFGPVSDSDLEDTWFVIADAGHLRPTFLGSQDLCSFNEDCIRNAYCTTLNSAVDDAKYAVAHMQWIAGAFLYMCSGGLLTDTAGSGTPYFLSANHCISRGKDARNLETFFQLFETDCNPDTCDDIFGHRANHPQALRTLGATILETSRTSDFTLFELNEAAPAGSAFLGWTDTPVANSDTAPLYRISHPAGAAQAYSTHEVDTSKGTCSSWPRGAWIYSEDTFGATEGGSSGSPVVNVGGQVVGQLSGACGLNPGDVCDVSNATVDGAFANYFSQVSSYLDPSPSSCTPSSEVCDDGTDNDCDGAADCSDSDCTGDPACGGGETCNLGGNKDSCNTNADCCSNNCKRGSCKGN